MVQRGASCKEIAQAVGISIGTISAWKRRYGVERRPYREHGISKHPNYGKDDTPEDKQMCLSCTEVHCTGWCPRIGYFNRREVRP